MLGPNRYGKSGVRLFKVLEQDVVDVTVSVLCSGNFTAAHVAGDNSAVLPTDTIKNTVYALAQDHLGHELERFAGYLVSYFLDHHLAAASIEVEIAGRPWSRIGGYAHAFVPAPVGSRVARVTGSGEGVSTEGGIRGMMVLKTTGSSFSGFPRDRFTTLPEAPDRLLATSVAAEWKYRREPFDYTAVWWGVHQRLIDDFAARPSASVQEQGYRMGQAVLDAHPEIDEIRLHLPNRHHLAVELERFGMEDRRVVFQPVDEPYGDIALTVRRAESS